MHIKTLLLLSVLASPSLASAQSVAGSENANSAVRGIRYELGVWTGSFVSLSGGDVYYALDNLYGVLIGASARLRIGNNHRLGFELAALHGVTGSRPTEIKDWAGWETETADFHQTSTTLSLQFQVHPGRDGQAFRPFVRVGLGAVADRYLASRPLRHHEGEYVEMYLEPMLQLETGVTWEINSRWYASQSVYYRYDLSYAGSAIGMRLGLLYSL